MPNISTFINAGDKKLVLNGNLGLATLAAMNRLYYGDNLTVLRDNIPNESVDLIYLDPPFNSKRDYAVLFKSPSGQESQAQITAFEDSWHWGVQAEQEFDELLHQPNTDVAEMMKALRAFLGENDMMAYLTMMANRLLQLHRVLKPTGSLYLHCDPTASHYLKIVMDGVFGKENYRNEIIWKRTSAHNDPNRWGNVHDSLFFYAKKSDYHWNNVFQKYEEAYLDVKYRNEDKKGRYRLGDLTGSGTTEGESCKPWKGFSPVELGRHWAPPTKIIEEAIGDDAADTMSSHEKLDWLDANGFIYWTPRGKGGGAGFPQYKRYLTDGVPIQDVISDISPINSQAQERLGYPTQKPLALLERIITASSNEGDVVLDPFCGCGTAVHAAQKLKRQWIGIDITHLAISLIEKRLKDAFKTGLQFEVHGTPKDLASARDLAHRDKYQFQWWAVSLVEAQPFQGKKKGADTGIDGIKFFGDFIKVKNNAEYQTSKIIVSVKGGENVGPTMVKDLIATCARDGAEIGLFITLAEPTKAMKTEASAAGFYESSNGKKYPRIQLLTIEDLLSGKSRAEHPNVAPDLNFKKAKPEADSAQKEML